MRDDSPWMRSLARVMGEWSAANHPVAEDQTAVALELEPYFERLLEANQRGETGSLIEGTADLPEAVLRSPFVEVIGDYAFLPREVHYLSAIARRLVNTAIRQPYGVASTADGTVLSADQVSAVAGILENRVSLVSGGPGTGKTFTICCALATLLRANLVSPVDVVFTAPTGKAVNRLKASLAKALPAFGMAESAETILNNCQTIHRLLGATAHGQFRRDHEHPVFAKTVIVDEASMIDLELLYRLLDAIDGGARIIIAGDHHQLFPINPGPVFSSLCFSFAQESPHVELPYMATLETPHRHASGRELAALLGAIRERNAEAAAAQLATRTDEVLLIDPDETEDWRERLRDLVGDGFAGFSGETSVEAMLARQQDFRILTTSNRGPLGVDALNRFCAEALGRAAEGSADAPALGTPVMALQNRYDLDIFNGDSGVVTMDAATRQPRLAFAGAEGPAYVAPTRLRWTAAYAITVHKSQGSEYDTVVAILEDSPRMPLDRQLLYTAFSRARNRLIIIGKQADLVAAIGREPRSVEAMNTALHTLLLKQIRNSAIQEES